MFTRDLLLSIPQALSLCVLAEWLELFEILDLDNAYCSKASRPKFLALLASPDISYAYQPWPTINPIKYIEWLNRRSIHLSFIRLPRELVPDVATYRNLCNEFFTRSGAALRNMEFVDKLIEKKEIWDDEDDEGDDDGEAEEEFSTVGIIQFHDILPILRHCPNLTELTLPKQFQSAEATVQDITAVCPHLSKLTLPSSALFTAPTSEPSCADWDKPGVRCVSIPAEEGAATDFVLDFADAEPVLHTLGVWCPSAVRSVPVCCQLRTLHVAHARVSDDLVQMLLPLNPHLKCLYLQCPDRSITDESLLCVAEHCRELTELYIRSSGISDVGIAAIVEQCTLLTTLNLDYSYKLSDEALIAIAKHGRNLHTLSIDNCFKLTEFGLSAIAKQLTSLKSLTLTPGCVYWFSDENAMKVLEDNGCTVVCTIKANEGLFDTFNFEDEDDFF